MDQLRASLTIVAVFSVGSVQSGYKEVFCSIEQYRTGVGSEGLSFETPACRDVSLGGQDLN
jgi:hypothetical protein